MGLCIVLHVEVEIEDCNITTSGWQPKYFHVRGRGGEICIAGVKKGGKFLLLTNRNARYIQPIRFDLFLDSFPGTKNLYGN